MILLTYKRKILLMRKDFILDRREQNVMHIIVGVRDGKESFEEAVIKSVKKETGITLKTTRLLSHTSKAYFFHAQLTDADVNSIVRNDGELLEFFSLKELGTLSLTAETQVFFTKHRDLLEKVDQVCPMGTDKPQLESQVLL